MRKIKVERELPFAKKGKILSLHKQPCGYYTDDLTNDRFIFLYHDLENWIKGGWLSWVEEPQSLEEEMIKWSGDACQLDDWFFKHLAQIATDKFKKKFDDFAKEHFKNGYFDGFKESTRKALFGDDNWRH